MTSPGPEDGPEEFFDDKGTTEHFSPGNAGPDGARASDGPQQQQGPQPYELFWHGRDYGHDDRAWLVREMIFEAGVGLASGQWGIAKTFVVLDLSASVMTGTAFAGRAIDRRGGVLFIAAEGAFEIPIRLKGLVEHKLRPAAVVSEYVATVVGENLGQPPMPVDPDALPFAWIADCPNLQDKGDFDRLVASAELAARDIRERFNLPLVLIVIDTLNAVGNFKDGNDAAEGQRVMNRLVELGRQTGAFALAVDHFGKMVETGTRGSSAKEAAADVVLALLGDREINGTLSNTRMAIRKLRGGKVGVETAFALPVVDVGEGETTCIVDWKTARPATQAPAKAKDRWPKSLRIFKVALETALVDQGKPMRPYASEGAEVRAASYDDVRREFMAAYPADASDAKAKAHAKQMAFRRALKQARDKELICSREIEGSDYLWLFELNGNKPHSTGHKQHTPL